MEDILGTGSSLLIFGPQYWVLIGLKPFAGKIGIDGKKIHAYLFNATV